MRLLHFHEDEVNRSQQVNEGKKLLGDEDDQQNQKPKTSKKS